MINRITMIVLILTIMELYLVNRNAQPNGDYEVHKEGCHRMPEQYNRHMLGYFNSCHDAVRAAKKHYWQSNGCYYCCSACHTT